MQLQEKRQLQRGLEESAAAAPSFERTPTIGTDRTLSPQRERLPSDAGGSRVKNRMKPKATGFAKIAVADAEVGEPGANTRDHAARRGATKRTNSEASLMWE